MNNKTEESKVSTSVIVAAGMGTRLCSGKEIPKPLMPILGVPLISRVMGNAAKAGIRRFVIVIGHRKELMAKELPLLIPKGCDIEFVINPRYKEPNGLSLLAAAENLKEPFALLMSDHLFSAERLKTAINCFAVTNRCILVVEKKQIFEGDIEDATMVTVNDGKVTAIGKKLLEYDAIDTGMFVLTPDKIVSALHNAGDSPSISDGMRILANAGMLDALTVDIGFWQDVDTPDDFRTAEQKLSFACESVY